MLKGGGFAWGLWWWTTILVLAFNFFFFFLRCEAFRFVKHGIVVLSFVH